MVVAIAIFVAPNSVSAVSQIEGLAPLIPEPAEDGYVYIEWDSLMPSSYSGGAFDPEGLGVVEELIGKNVSIPGFIVPLDTNGQTVLSFLFVPYVGACIHVPPPPPNQLIYVTSEEGVVLDKPWIPMEIFGTLGAELVETGLGSAGYTMSLEQYKPFVY